MSPIRELVLLDRYQCRQFSMTYINEPYSGHIFFMRLLLPFLRFYARYHHDFMVKIIFRELRLGEMPFKIEYAAGVEKRN